MAIKYSEVEGYLNRIKINIHHEIKMLEEIIITDRENSNIPVYITKCRIKSIDSIFLKTKRKNLNNLDEITDIGGLRILCLFEKDIFAVHDYLLRLFIDKNYELEEMKVYNWDYPPYSDKLKDIYKAHFKTKEAKYENKESGYKSIHYIVQHNAYTLELQLRTLLQDVWGELEHSLSYKKGEIHPHIKKSFSLLARDLETNDFLMTHLRDINERENCGETFLNKKAIPRNYMNYEPALIPKVFHSPKLNEHFEAYNHQIKQIDFKKIQSVKDGITEANKLYEAISNEITGADWKDKKVGYWLKMEMAFILFCQHKYDDALNIYSDVKSNCDDNYCVFFRMGEIYFHKKDIVKALASFDESEKLLSTHATIDEGNLYWIKLRLALIYWMLGDEYIDIAIDKINEAEKIYHENESVRNTNKLSVLINNICWYHLSKFISTKKKEDKKIARIAFDKVTEIFCELEKYIDENTVSNLFDTAAWYCYHAFLWTKDVKYLEKAKDYCMRMNDSINYSSSSFMSKNIQLNHVQEIMNIDA